MGMRVRGWRRRTSPSGAVVMPWLCLPGSSAGRADGGAGATGGPLSVWVAGPSGMPDRCCGGRRAAPGPDEGTCG